MAKLYIRHAFRIILVNLQDWDLLGTFGKVMILLNCDCLLAAEVLFLYLIHLLTLWPGSSA